MPKQRDVVLIPIPFTDLSSNRRRPAIVVSNNDYNNTTQDIVVVAMTSNPEATSFSFLIEQKDMAAGILNRPGKVRADKIFTLSQDIVLKVFGQVTRDVLVRIQQLWARLVVEA